MGGVGESPEVNPDKQAPRRTTRAGGRLPWQQDLVVLARLPQVERRHLAGQFNTQIAEALGVDESTVREDLKRLRLLWLKTIKEKQESLRAEKVAELADIKRRAIHQAEWDEACERAVLYDDATMPDYELERLGIDPKLRVARDSEGRAQFRGQKAASLNVARQAVMDQAKVLGLIVDKVSVTGDLVREAEKAAAELGLDPENAAKVIDFAKRAKRAG